MIMIITENQQCVEHRARHGPNLVTQWWFCFTPDFTNEGDRYQESLHPLSPTPLFSFKAPLLQFLVHIQGMNSLSPFWVDLAHVHPNPCSSSGWHQLPTHPSWEGLDVSTTGCTISRTCYQVTRQDASLAYSANGKCMGKHRPPVWRWIAKLWNHWTGHLL